MLKIIKERTPVTTTEYFIEFKYKDDPESGFSFPALAIGSVDYNKMCYDAVTNYHKCLTDSRLYGPEFKKYTNTYIDPGVGRCSCGRQVILDCDYAGAVRCECGKWYNLFGQSLIDPKYWYKDEDDYYSDMPD